MSDRQRRGGLPRFDRFRTQASGSGGVRGGGRAPLPSATGIWRSLRGDNRARSALAWQRADGVREEIASRSRRQ